METAAVKGEKIWFSIDQDQDGYPPVKFETMWVSKTAGGAYRLENIPFFAKGVSSGDVVSISKRSDGENWFETVLSASGHSTLRVIVFRESLDKRPLEERVQEIRDRLFSLGCPTELSHLPGLFAVDVPPPIKFTHVRSLLNQGAARGLWDYEEANLRNLA